MTTPPARNNSTISISNSHSSKVDRFLAHDRNVGLAIDSYSQERLKRMVPNVKILHYGEMPFENPIPFPVCLSFINRMALVVSQLGAECQNTDLSTHPTDPYPYYASFSINRLTATQLTSTMSKYERFSISVDWQGK
jgi:hypothetical protein